MKTNRLVAMALAMGLVASGRASFDTPVTESVEVLQQGAAIGDPAAQYSLGLAYLQGKGVAKDPARALEWFRKAATAGLKWAQYNSGIMLSNGTDVPRDDKEAARWFFAAAQSGLFDAQVAMIKCFVAGRGVEKSPGKALAWDMIARRTLELRSGLPAGLPPMPAASHSEGVGKDGKTVPTTPAPGSTGKLVTVPTATPTYTGTAPTKNFDDPTAFRKPNIGTELQTLEKIETESNFYAGATAPEYQQGQASAKAYLIPLPQAQKPGTAPAWLRENTISQATMHESPLLPIPDDRSSKVPFGVHGSAVIKMQPWKHAETEHFIIHYVGDSEARLTVQYIEGVYTVLTQLLNLDPQRGLTKSHVFIFPESAWKDYREKMSLSPQLAGFAFKTELLLGAATTREDRAESTKVICHEVTHALVSRFYPGQKAPLWLNEGLAEYIALRTMRIKAGAAFKKSDLRLLRNPDKAIDMTQLFTRIHYGTQTSPDRLSAFYANSQKSVQVLFEKLPVEGFTRFFNMMIAGYDPNIALETAYGKQCGSAAAFGAIVNAN